MPAWPALMIGAEAHEPLAPLLLTVNVPAGRSSTPSLLRRALSISSPPAIASPLIESLSAFLMTGTTRFVGQTDRDADIDVFVDVNTLGGPLPVHQRERR